MRFVSCLLFVFLTTTNFPLHESVENGSELDGAFGDEDMKSLLHWAIEHSDPEKLREQAAALSKEDMEHRRQRVEELSEIMSQQVTETELMHESIAVLKNTTSTEAEVIHGLKSLQIHVERIDNANDLKNLDGIECVVEQLEYQDKRSSEAAIVLGVAASNNPTFQKHLIETDPHIFSKLIKLLNCEDQVIVGNSLYAISSLLRNTESMRTLFYTNGGLKAIHEVLENNLESLRVKKKCLALLADLIQLGELEITDGELIDLIVKLLNDENWDIVEKASITISLLAQNPQSLAKLKSLDIGSVLMRTKQSAILELQKSDEKSEYFQEIVTALEKLLHTFQSDQHMEL